MALISIKANSVEQACFRELDVPGEKVDPTSYHITLVYLGDNYPVDLFYKACQVVSSVVNRANPFTVEFNYVSWFPRKKGKHAIVMPGHATELQDLQANIQKALDIAQLPYSKDFKMYKPHLTLSYSEETPSRDLTVGIPFMVDANQVTMWPTDDGDIGEVNLPLCISPQTDKMCKSSIFCGDDTMSDASDILRSITERMAAAHVEQAFPEAKSTTPVQVTDVNPFHVVDARDKALPVFTSQVPASHRTEEEVRCVTCGALVRPSRGCFRCKDVPEASNHWDSK